ncbi:hypothetical protein G5B10_13985 [Fluviicola sp. SGL-29]|nr:hypothetical protein [Fluviicola sp. SGL-29]
MIRILVFGLLLITAGCGNETSIVEIRINSLLHDDSSKVWMVESERIDGVEHAPENINFRTVITFYADSKFSEQPLNTIGNRPPKYGSFEIADQNITMDFRVDNKQNTYLVDSYSKERIVLMSADKGKYRTELTLIPLPKL